MVLLSTTMLLVGRRTGSLRGSVREGDKWSAGIRGEKRKVRYGEKAQRCDAVQCSSLTVLY